MQLPLSIMLIGAPNVGKSLIFNYLTGMYVTVSNYPGTTVDVCRGKMMLDGAVYEVYDTPGLYSLIPMTEEENVTRNMLCDGKPKLIIHVIDAKHIRRMCNLTLELLYGEFPVIVVLNMIDEAERLGMAINAEKLSELLGAPVIKASAISGLGLRQLRQEIRRYRFRPGFRTKFDNELEQVIEAISGIMPSSVYGMSARLAAILALQQDKTIIEKARQVLDTPIQAMTECQNNILRLRIAAQQQAAVDKILTHCVRRRKVTQSVVGETVSRITRQPATGIPILLLVLYIGLYGFVGRFGAGVLVDYLDKIIFGEYLLPFVSTLVVTYVPSPMLQSLLIGDYGFMSLGLRYAVAIILPIVSTFFLAFALLEDSGYLPRLAMLLNNVCRWFGLNGRAVIPLSLGFGCGTMAVMVTRTLETKRERLLATFVLALAIPCSAQLGLIIALLSQNPVSLLIWAGILAACIIIGGLSANMLLPGKRSLFYMELPPIRLPRLSNVLIKAYTRMIWYMKEIIPVFICVSLLLWMADRFGWIKILAESLQPALVFLGLPSSLATIFILGFFRRDYGAAGLYDLAVNGLLNEKQLLVAAVALTLFLPCVAQLIVMVKERGLIEALLLIMIIVVIAYSVAWLVHLIVNPAWLS